LNEKIIKERRKLERLEVKALKSKKIKKNSLYEEDRINRFSLAPKS
jgi:hypothetical protein